VGRQQREAAGALFAALAQAEDNGLTGVVVEGDVRTSLCKSAFHLWHHAQLLQHTKIIDHIPTLLKLAIFDSVDNHPAHVHRLARCWNTQIFALVGALSFPTNDKFIAIDGTIFNCKMYIRERSSQGRSELFFCLPTDDVRHTGDMANVIGCEYLIYD
jgi:hypothetical protein